MHVDRPNKDHDTGRNIDMALWIVAKAVSHDMNNGRSRTIQSDQSCHSIEHARRNINYDSYGEKTRVDGKRGKEGKRGGTRQRSPLGFATDE